MPKSGEKRGKGTGPRGETEARESLCKGAEKKQKKLRDGFQGKRKILGSKGSPSLGAGGSGDPDSLERGVPVVHRGPGSRRTPPLRCAAQPPAGGGKVTRARLGSTTYTFLAQAGAELACGGPSGAWHGANPSPGRAGTRAELAGLRWAPCAAVLVPPLRAAHKPMARLPLPRARLPRPRGWPPGRAGELGWLAGGVR